MGMQGPTYKYGRMSSQWNRPNTAYIVSPVGAELGYLVLQPIARKVASVLYTESAPYNLRLYSPHYMREQGWHRGGSVPLCFFGMMQSHSLPVLYEAIDSLRIMAEDDPQMVFNVEFPGRGVLSDVHVRRALRQLPSNVHIWQPGRAPVEPVVEEDDDDTEADS